MTARTYFTSAKFTPHRHNQDEVAGELTEFAAGVHALGPNGWSRPSQPCATAVAYPKMTGFTEASNA
jgi:hypothetical protein